MNRDDKGPRVARSRAGVLGLGAAACAACCAGPILGALGAIGMASTVGYVMAGAVAVLAGSAGAAALIVRRRRRRSGCAARTGTVAMVDAPTTRLPNEPVAPGTVERRHEPSAPA